MTGRLRAIVVKELWAVLRDPRGRLLLILPPILQLVLFSAAATLEVRNVALGVYDRDGGAASAEFVGQLAGSPNFRRLVRVDTPRQLADAVDSQRVIGVVVFDEGFSRDVAARRPAAVQLVLDGRRSNAAQIVAGYVSQVAVGVGVALRPSLARVAGGGTVVRNWFNPNLDYLWFIMPALLVQIGAISALSVTAQSIARERELGSFDQLMVSPLRTWEILVGKVAPPFLIGLANATIYLLVIPLYGVPVEGSLLLFYAALSLFLLSAIGVGLAISAISQTQQQAFLGMFVAMVPMILLSGFASPVDNMPAWLRVVAQADPLKHFLVVAEGTFLGGMTAADVFANSWPVAIIAAVTLSVAVWQFRARTE